MHSSDITLKNISKIEGHSDLYVGIRDKEVKSVKLGITENKRFYTQAIRGKNIMALPQHVSRICGTCSIAHLICCIEAIEKTLNLKPSPQTITLRKLAMYGLMIRDHALHLYIFAMPDLLNKDSILELDKSDHHLIHEAFKVKAAGNHLSTLIAGRAVHAMFPTVGGFLSFPNKKDSSELIKRLKQIRPAILRLIDLFYNSNFSLIRKTNFVALAAEEFGFLEGKIKSSAGYIIEEKDFYKHLHHVVIPYSQASGYEFEGKEYMVGALARLNLNKDNLHKSTKKATAKYLKVFPSNNIFHNNLAQAIEILHSIDHSIEILNKSFKKEPLIQPKLRDSEGIGVVEAPRGTLYYRLNIKKDGTIKDGSIIVPTAQNQINMEKDIKQLVQSNISKPKEFIIHEIEKLIRAYDPCMSCASHFLKVHWI